VNLGGAMQRASDVLIPKLLGLFTSPHDGIRAMVSAKGHINEPSSLLMFFCSLKICRRPFTDVEGFNRGSFAVESRARMATPCADADLRRLPGPSCHADPQNSAVISLHCMHRR